MGYNLSIGEFSVASDPEERYCAGTTIIPEGVDTSGAPLNSGDDYDASCSPGYIAWSNFCREVGLLQVFFAPDCPCDTCNTSPYVRKCPASGKSHWWVRPDGEEDDGLIRGAGHPGVKALTDQHLIEFKRARQNYLALPEPRPGLVACLDYARKYGEPCGDVDYNLRRLDWLVWWTEWALEHCDHPTFENG